MNLQYGIIMLSYLVLMLAIGLYVSKRVKGLKDYWIAGGSQGAEVVGLSYTSTHVSGSSFMGAIGVTSFLGYNFLPVMAISAAAPWFSFQFLGERLRKVAERIGALTLPDIFEARYETSKIKLLVAMIFIVGFIPYLVAQLKGGATVFNVFLGVDYRYGLLIFGLIVVLYTVIGGMYAVMWTDLIQAIIMLVGFVILIPVALNFVGGFSSLNAQYGAIDPNLLKLTGVKPVMWIVTGIIFWSIFQMGGGIAPIVRFFAAKDTKTMRRAFIYAVCACSFIYGAYIVLAPAGLVMFPDNTNADMFIPLMIKELLPPLVGGILMGALLAAMMSTIDSVLLIIGSAASRDIFQKFIKPEAPEKTQLLVARVFTFIIGVVAIIIALNPPAVILWLTTFTWSINSAAFAIPLVATFWWRRATKMGAILGISTGAIVCFLWYFAGWTMYNAWNVWPLNIWPGVIGGAIGGLVLVVASYLTKPVSKETLDTFYT